MQKAPAKSSSTTTASKNSGIKPAAASNPTKTATTSNTKSSQPTILAKKTVAPSSSVKKTTNSTAVKQPNLHKEEKKAPLEEKKEVAKMNIEKIELKQLLAKLEVYREKNRPLLIIDQLEMNDSFTFFKYKGYVADLSEYSIKELTNVQNREKSIENARRQVVVALRAGGTLVFNLDKMLVDFQNFFQGATFFSPQQLFTPQEALKEEYYVKKLLKEEENVDGFGNKGGYVPNKDFSAVILSKSSDISPEELLKKLNMPADLFDCIIIS